MFAATKPRETEASGGGASVQNQIRNRKRVQRQIDEARSRVDEVKDLVRTALAHHFVSRMQERNEGCFRGLFVRWVNAVGLKPTIDAPGAQPASAGSNATPVGGMSAGGSSSTDIRSPALERLGITPAGSLAGKGEHRPVWIRSSSLLPLPEVQAAASAAAAAASAGAAVSPRDAARRSHHFAGHVPEEVLAVRGFGRVVEYRVKWKGFASSQSVTWELGSQLSQLKGFKEALGRFRASRGVAGL